MPGKKRPRWDGEIEEEEVPKRNKCPDLDLENGVSPPDGVHGSPSSQRPNSRAGDKVKRIGPTCKTGHDLVKVSKEVRRLEKETPWSCDNSTCKYSWDSETDTFLDRPRHRCVQYTSGNTGCNYDLCEDCYNLLKAGETEEPRRSSREIKPKYRPGDGEWIISPKFQTRTNPSPKSTQSENNMINGEVNGDGPKSPPMSPRTRHTRSTQQPRSRSPPTAAGRSPRARSREKEPETESDFEERRSKRCDDDSPFYPSVRFSPSVKNGSPYGRRTRSGGRRNMTSYLQSLASEDEQSEFNRQYSRDLRKRQARKLSEEGQEERRSTRSRGEGETYHSPRGRRVRVDLDQYEHEEEGEEDLETRRSTRSTHPQPQQHTGKPRRRLRSMSEDERPLATRRQRNNKDISKLDPSEEEETPLPTRRRGAIRAHSEEEETPLPERRRRGRPTREHSEEEETPLPPRRRRATNRNKVVEQSDDEDEGDPTVTEASVRRSNRRRNGPRLDAEDADTESGAEKHEGEDGEGDEEGGEETEGTEEEDSADEHVKSQEETRRSSRRNRNPVKRFSYEAPPRESIRERRNTNLENMDKYGSDEEFNGGASPKKRKYSLRTVRANTDRYQPEMNGDVPLKDRGLIRNTVMSGRASRPRERKKSNRNRTGDSSSPTSSSCSDQEAFERRKSKRMGLEREKMRPMNMSGKDMSKAIFKERSKVGASLADVQPMEMDSGVSFDSVGGLKEYVNSLKEMVMFPLLYPELFEQFKIIPPRGVLFYGPPGTGKTLLARALANECSTETKKVAFFMRKGADCLSKWIGESERQLRLLFDQAYQMRPSIIFFDEIDGLAPVRSSRQDQIHSSIVSTLLALMDGLDNRGEIVIIGATNRIENIDPALRRPGRFDRELRFSLPCKPTRKEILKLHTKSWDPPLNEPLMNVLAARTLGYCGADLKGLTAEAALNALRRLYPQVYESSQKLAIDLKKINVIRDDFDKALRKIVPSTHRVEDKVLSPLPRHMKPLLEASHLTLVANLKKMFPHCAVGKGAIIPKTLTHRPRLMIVGSDGQGQSTYIGPALLHFLEKFPCQKLDIPALFSNSARTPEEACTQIIHSARRTMPGILYIPHLCMLWDTISETVRATLTTLLLDIPPTAPLLILALSNRPYKALTPEVQSMFLPFYREVFKIQNPTENERREYFRPLIVSCTALPSKPKAATAVIEPLPVLPAPETRKLTEREEKRLRRKEESLLRELRIFLRDIWAKINRESKFFMFRSPVNTEEVDDYLDYVKNPMDFEKMHQKLDDGEYSCAQDFLDDIDLIANNATAYNCDLAYETNRIICHRARALQDFCYALVKTEMDTDFEDECKSIVERRHTLTDKLKKMAKDKPVELQPSPSKMQDMMAIVELACKICGKTSDDSNMLICDGCDNGYHTYCTNPPIKQVPDGDWFCPNCVAAGLTVGATNETPGEPGSAGGSGGQKKRRRHRRSAWSSGVIRRPKHPVKKKLLSSDNETNDAKEDNEEEEKVKDDSHEINENVKKKEEEIKENGNEGEHEEEIEEEGKGVVEEKDKIEEEEPMEVCPKISRSASLRNKSKDDTENRITEVDLAVATPQSSRGEVQVEPSTSISQILDEPATSNNDNEEAEPEKVLVVNENELAAVHEDIVLATEGYTVEALERAYATLAKVVRKYRMLYDRTNLSKDLRRELTNLTEGFTNGEHEIDE